MNKTSISALILMSLLLMSSSAMAIQPGDTLPNISLHSNSGGDISLSSLKGKVLYVDVWASWCASCAQSIPWMGEIQSKFDSNHFKVITINVDEHSEKADMFLKKKNVSLTVAYDPKGTFPESIEMKAMPTSFLLDKDGKVILVHEGFSLKDAPKLEAEIEKALVN